MKFKFWFSLLLIMLVAMFAVSCSSEPNNTATVESSTNSITTQALCQTTEGTTTSMITSSVESSTAIPESTSTPTPNTSTAPEVHTISPEEAKHMMGQANVIVVDVRRADEYEAGHLPGAILVPNETILTEAAKKLPDKNAVLLIYCRSGRRSAEAAQKLISIGYIHVYDFGGILDWPYEITK